MLHTNFLIDKYIFFVQNIPASINAVYSYKSFLLAVKQFIPTKASC